MFEKPIDFKKLHKALSDTYKRQMEIKKEFPHRFSYPQWTYEKSKSGEYKKEMEARRPWQKARSEFDSLSYRMTMLCCILNHAKGKLHMQKLLDKDDVYGWEFDPMTLKAQAAIIGSAWEEFAVGYEEEQAEKIVEEHVQEHAKKPQGVFNRILQALGR